MIFRSAYAVNMNYEIYFNWLKYKKKRKADRPLYCSYRSKLPGPITRLQTQSYYCDDVYQGDMCSDLQSAQERVPEGMYNLFYENQKMCKMCDNQKKS